MKRGEVCALPTDTVYGFSGIVGGEMDAAKKIKLLKSSSQNAREKPFIQLVSSVFDITSRTPDSIPEKILSLLPNALTIIVRTPTAENPFCTTAFRYPRDEWLLSVIKMVGSPIYSTSANKSGGEIITSAKKIESDFPSLALVVDGGEKKNSIPSTIVRIEKGSGVTVIREGVVKV